MIVSISDIKIGLLRHINLLVLICDVIAKQLDPFCEIVNSCFKNVHSFSRYQHFNGIMRTLIDIKVNSYELLIFADESIKLHVNGFFFLKAIYTAIYCANCQNHNILMTSRYVCPIMKEP